MYTPNGQNERQDPQKVGIMSQAQHSRLTTGACYDFPPPPSTLKTTREESKMSNVHTTLFQNSFVLVS